MSSTQYNWPPRYPRPQHAWLDTRQALLYTRSADICRDLFTNQTEVGRKDARLLVATLFNSAVMNQRDELPIWLRVPDDVFQELIS